MANNEPTIDAHVKKMLTPGTWATQVEVYAASSFFQVPLYSLWYTTSTNYHWEVAKPINKEKLRFPLIADNTSDEDTPQHANQLSHFELAYLKCTHYDSIVDSKSGIPSSTLPILTPPSSQTVILVD